MGGGCASPKSNTARGADVGFTFLFDALDADQVLCVL